MAEFVYRDYSCKLKFGEYVFDVPLNEQTAQLIDETFNQALIDAKPDNIEEIDKLYNQMLDGIDVILGDGAADKIMGRFAHPGTLEITGVVVYIVQEWREKYAEAVEEMKKTTPTANRETRRARR